MDSYTKTFVLLLGVAYFAGAQAQNTTIASVVVNPTATASQYQAANSVAASQTQATVNVVQSQSATAVAAVATPAASPASQAGGPTTSAVSGGGAQSAANSQATPTATSGGAGAGAGANPSPSSPAANNAVVSATTAVANPAQPSAGAGNQAPASSSVKVTKAPPKPTAVAIEMKINKGWSADYNNQSSSLFKNLSRDLYTALNSTLYSHGLYNVTIVSVKAGSIIVNMKLYFLVSSGSSTNIEEVIKNDKDKKLSSFGVDLKSLAITFPGVTLGAWKPKSNECATKCCDGAGGSLNLERTCTPSASCGGISLTKTVSNSCTTYCKDVCNSGTVVQASISTFILAALALIRTLA